MAFVLVSPIRAIADNFKLWLNEIKLGALVNVTFLWRTPRQQHQMPLGNPKGRVSTLKLTQFLPGLLQWNPLISQTAHVAVGTVAVYELPLSRPKQCIFSPLNVTLTCFSRCHRKQQNCIKIWQAKAELRDFPSWAVHRPFSAPLFSAKWREYIVTQIRAAPNYPFSAAWVCHHQLRSLIGWGHSFAWPLGRDPEDPAEGELRHSENSDGVAKFHKPSLPTQYLN